MGSILSLLVIFFAAFGIIHPSLADTQRKQICPNVLLYGDFKDDLDPAEKRLVCGDLDAKPGSINEAWRNIPFPQVQFNLRNFFQARGYHHLKFRRDLVTEIIHVDIGPKTLVRSIRLEGASDHVDITRKRKLIGAPLTPALLNGVEKWVLERLQALGYACPVVKSQANPDTGEVVVKAEPGSLQDLVSIYQEGIPGVSENILRRYDAFKLGERYSGDLLTVTTNRVTASGMVESAHFTTQCTPQGAHIRQEVVAGPPRILTIGAGINTEGLLQGRITWRNTRLGREASWLEFSGYASARLQRITSLFNWYFAPEQKRVYLSPLVQFSHRDEKPLEDMTTRGQFGLSATSDQRTVGSTLFIGPTLDFFKTIRGIGAPTRHLLSLENRVAIKSHDFEFYAAQPQQGYQVQLISDFNHKNLFSDVTAQRIQLNGEVLWNYRRYDPPLWVLGLRGGFSTLITDERPGVNSALPVGLLQFLGGSADLRGFGRKSLPLPDENGVQAGALTAAFVGTELRLSHTLPFQLDPFLLLDVGALGDEPVSLARPVYWSPGFGIRWASPIGAIRTTLARGYIGSEFHQWQFYFSYGEEF